jgi:hypothetical protein
MEINQKAALMATKEIRVSASVEKVWSILIDINSWNVWQSDISYAKLEGSIANGIRFQWKAKGLKINSMIQEFEPNTHIGWVGKSLGMSAIHRWILVPEGGETHVFTEESLEGWFPRLLKIIDSMFLEKSLSDALNKLKLASE